MEAHPKVDVVTIGAGWTAGILASFLAPAGHSIVSLEMGPERWADPDYAHDHDTLRYAIRKQMMVDLSRNSWTWRPNPTAPSLPMRKYGSFHPGAGLGGASAHWSGMLWRFMESDFRYRSHHVERYGASKLPEGVQVQDWPLAYQDLERYYDAFEYDIGASGQAGNLKGKITEGGNPFEAPRARPFPLPPLATTLASDLFAEAARGLGYRPFVQPSGILSRAYQDRFGNVRGGCLYCGFCTRHGCEVDAKSSAGTTHIPYALKTGNYQIRFGAQVTRIEVASNGLATGVTYVDGAGNEHFQPAEVVVASAFTLDNNRLLLLSKSDTHPKGVGNDRGRVGKNYTYQHWHALVDGTFAGRRFNLFMGNTSTIWILYEFNGDNFDHSDVDFIGGGSLFAGLGESDPLGAGEAGPISEDNAFGKDLKDFMRNSWDSSFSITTQGESLPYEDQFLDLDPTFTDFLGRPLLRLTFDWHENDRRMYAFLAQKAKDIMERMGPTRMKAHDTLDDYNIHKYQSTHPTGGCIMGTDPGNSVTNSYGQVWDTPNVFVTGAALYPQNPGANPTGTVGALAYRTSEALRDRYFRRPGELL